MSLDGMSVELRRLVRRRTAVQSSIEVINKYAERFNPEVHSHRQLRNRLSKLNEFICQLDSIHSDILLLDQGCEEDEKRLIFEDEMYTLVSTLEDLIAKYDTPAPNVASSAASESLKLPAINMPKFDGKLSDWASFIDTFNALFHNNSKLSNVQRLHYLKTSVIGPAADIIQNFSITAENYQVAYDELVRQYENKGLTIQTHIRALLQSPKVNVASATELRSLHHHVASHVRALKALGQPVQHWDAWLVTLICGLLDPVTAGEWQLRQDNKDLPTYVQLESFLSRRVVAYEVGAISNGRAEERPNRGRNASVNNKTLFTHPDMKGSKCPACQGPHRIYACEKFIQMPILERTNLVSKSKLCFNCLNFGHQVASCKYPSCPKCGKRHNSKLHEDVPATEMPTTVPPTGKDNEPKTVLCTRNSDSMEENPQMNVMLATVMINIKNKFGQSHLCRAVLDSGSQMHFITQSCANALGLTLSNTSSSIVGVGAMASSSRRSSWAAIHSRVSNHKYYVQLHSLPTIVNALPAQPLDQFNNISIPKHIKSALADPQFHIPGPIDVLLGAEVFFDALQSEKWSLSPHASLQQTKFGWIVTGKLPYHEIQKPVHTSTLSGITLNNSAIALFSKRSVVHTSEESKAEDHFISTFARDEDGRFVVRLPFNEKLPALGDSRFLAQKRFFNLEKRLLKDEALAEQYELFMSEYLSLGHMEVAEPVAAGSSVYYLPHHPVFKANSTTTKVRVVFDGSAVTSSGLSLNDVTLKGPKIQPDIYNILLRFRMHRVAITADVAKMYRQISVNSKDRDFQRILYRSEPAEPLKEYRLCTVTYGTKSASFLSTRCLVQLGTTVKDHSVRRALLEDFYVDDLISGGSSEQECFEIHEKLLGVLKTAGFPLRKWCSSSQALMNRMPAAHDDPSFMLPIKNDDTVSALGLVWRPNLDCFCFIFKEWSPPTHMTKRSLLSDINSIYDPLGLISPPLIVGKIFIQQLWSLKMGWDDLLPDDLRRRWIRFYESLRFLEAVNIPRNVVDGVKPGIMLHGFSDASQDAFGACVYVRSVNIVGTACVRLYTSKSRVAPIKPTTIPRLELCGALLLAEVMSEVLAELGALGLAVSPTDVFQWSDSTIVLAWIKNEKQFQSYVSNRLARIHDLTSPGQWSHVPTTDNPADLITRGMDARSIINSELWWNGPSWLSQNRAFWPGPTRLPDELPELKVVKLVLTTTQALPSALLNQFSNFMHLVRIIATVRRFISNCKGNFNSCDSKAIGPLTTQELNAAKENCIRISQVEAYSAESQLLKAGKSVHRSSCLARLNPYIDGNGLIRVGGRLTQAPLKHDTKFPIVLPPKSNFTKLLFKYEHIRLLHVGPQALLASIQVNYWPIRGRSLASRTTHQCLTCFRSKPTLAAPFMAPLPRLRVSIGRPFLQCGVDFCGPLMIRSGIRRVQLVKAYIAVFVCFATRAVHLELVSSLTSEAFLAALSRFISRRGSCANMYSDNGTNFVGANRILINNFHEISKHRTVSSFFAEKSMQWHFIPPSTPHFGGLWEAAVKSAKKHLTKMAANLSLTFEEANTLLCNIEAVLNSRPMTPLSSDPSDYSALTPSHFLVGGPITLPAEPDVSSIPHNRLRRFALVQAQVQHFWSRWSREYLPQLQCRGRWLKLTREIKIGDLCLLHNENLAPTRWPLVRVQDIHPGPDGIVRVVTVRNSAGVSFRRALIKLAVLPSTEDEENINAA